MISDRLHMPKMARFRILLLLLLGHSVHSYNILVVCPIAGKSLGFICDAFVRNLLGAGHQVTYITPFPKQNETNLQYVDVGETALKLYDKYESIFNLKEKLENPQEIDFYTSLEIGEQMNEWALTNKNFNNFIMGKERFDAVIVDFFESPVLAGLSALFDCPLIWGYSLGLDWRIAELVGGEFSPAHTSDYLSSSLPPYDMNARIKQLWARTWTKYYKKWYVGDKEKALYEKYLVPAIRNRGFTPPKYEEIIHSGSLVLANTHHAIGGFPSLPLNIKLIGGIHIDDSSEINKDLKNILDKSEHGFIYFSMGTFWESKNIPDYFVEEILEIFGRLNQTVIWKYEENLNNLPPNVHTVKWAPQQRFLGHPKCVLFITHGGLLSSTEAIHFGVPIIGVPISFDQQINVERAVNLGYAVKYEFDFNLPKILESTIIKMIKDDKYKSKVKQLSRIYHDRPISVQKEFIHSVEHVIRTNGAFHWRSSSMTVNWYEKYYLDILTFVVIILILVLPELFVYFDKYRRRILFQTVKKYCSHVVLFCSVYFVFVYVI